MKILLFSPFTALWKNSVLEKQLMFLLSQSGTKHDIATMRCGEVFDEYCIPREYLFRGLEQKRKKQACRVCNVNNNILRFPQFSNVLFLREYLTEIDYKEAENFGEENYQRNPTQINHDGYPLGLISSYELLLKFKKQDFNYSLEELNYFKINLKNVYLTYKAAIKYFENTKVELIFVTHPQYSVGGILSEVAIRMNIPVYYLGGSSSIPETYQSLAIWK